MARKKVKLAWISNDATRRATLKKRRKGLIKKVNELSILCDVRACSIIYAPNEPQPEAWPSPQEATRMLSRFRAMPEMERCKKMMNQDSFLRQRVSKLHDQLCRQDRVIRELESAALLRECVAGASIDNLRIEELAALAWILEDKTKGIQDRIDHLRFTAAFEGTISGDAKQVAVECTAPTT
ncbi:agamous-like MADS-box protein AGL80, partial [Phalaenopsis equestris]